MVEAMPEVLELPSSVLLVVADATERGKVKALLIELGCADIVECPSGDAAIKLMAEAAYPMVLMDWELKGISGLALFNRIRQTPGYSLTPVIVLSKLLHKKAFELLREYPCSRHAEKPINQKTLEPIFFKVLEERTWYANNAEYVDRLLLKAKSDPKAATAELQRLLAEAPDPVALSLLTARALIDHRYYKAAAAMLEKVRKVAARSPAVMWLLARAYYLDGQSGEARKLLSQAERFSTSNLERLCFQGEVSLANHDTTKARAYFQKCLAIDPGYPRALSGKTIAANLDSYISSYAKDDLPLSLAITCNLLGVHLAQGGEVEQGIAQYEAALAFLGDADETYRIAFNLGYGYLRDAQLEKALEWFRRADEMAGGTFAKAKLYRAKVQQALAYDAPAPSVDSENLEEHIGRSNDSADVSESPLDIEGIDFGDLSGSDDDDDVGNDIKNAI